MSQADDERRLLRFIAERGGPAATMNVTGRGGEIGVDSDVIPDLVESLRAKQLVEILDDGDVRLTALGRTLTETVEG